VGRTISERRGREAGKKGGGGGRGKDGRINLKKLRYISSISKARDQVLQSTQKGGKGSWGEGEGQTLRGGGRKGGGKRRSRGRVPLSLVNGRVSKRLSRGG